MTPDWVYGVGLIAVLLALAGLVELWRRRRLHGLRRLAEQRGWTYEQTAPHVVGHFIGTPPFLEGLGNNVDGVVRGTADGRPFAAFRWTRESPGEGDADSRPYGRWGILAFPLGRSDLPYLHVATRADARWSAQDHGVVHPTGHPEVDRRYVVRTTDPDFARAVLRPDLLRAMAEGPSQTWRLHAHSFLVMRRRREWPAGQLDEAVRRALVVLQRVEPAVWAHPAGRPGR